MFYVATVTYIYLLLSFVEQLRKKKEELVYDSVDRLLFSSFIRILLHIEILSWHALVL